MLIAILTNVYSSIKINSLGLYLNQIVHKRKLLLQDDYYSGLVNAPFPLNSLLLPFIPFYAVMKNKSLNNFIQKVEYLISILLVSIFFAIFSFASIPLAYVKILIIKGRLLKRRLNLTSKKKRFNAFFIWVFLGIFILILNWFSEFLIFFKLAFKEKENLVLRRA